MPKGEINIDGTNVQIMVRNKWREVGREKKIFENYNQCIYTQNE